MNLYFNEVDASVSFKELLPWLGLFLAVVALLILFPILV